MALTLGHFLTLGAMLFAIAVVGIFLNRKNLIPAAPGEKIGKIFKCW